MSENEYTQERRAFVTELTLLHERAHRLGLYRTGHVLHEAVREVGWEIAGVPRPKPEPTR